MDKRYGPFTGQTWAFIVGGIVVVGTAWLLTAEVIERRAEKRVERYFTRRRQELARKYAPQ